MFNTKDPNFLPIVESLKSLFQLEITRNGKYPYPEVQHLKETIDDYHIDPSKKNYIELVKALRHSLYYIEKWHQLDFNDIKNAVEYAAQGHGMNPPNWPQLLSNSKASPQFQFSALHHPTQEENLLTWLSAKSGTPYDKLTPDDLTRLLIKHLGENGFSKKLGQYLRDEPDFLFNLIMKSEKNFTNILPTGLVLYLTDEQLAEAILKYTPTMDEEQISYEDVTLLVEQFNKNLSYGRSISTLLRNANAKAILDKSAFFRMYQSDEYINRDVFSSSIPYLEGQATKPFVN